MCSWNHLQVFNTAYCATTTCEGTPLQFQRKRYAACYYSPIILQKQREIKEANTFLMALVDRRPVDPPPVVQLECQRQEYVWSGYDDTLAKRNRSNNAMLRMLHDPSLFLYATLVDTRGDDLHFTNQATPSTAGAVVQSLHKLRDTENKGKCVYVCACVCAPPSWECRLLTFFWCWNLHIRFVFTLLDVQQKVDTLSLTT